MPTEEEIKSKYKALHDELTEIYYNQEPKGQMPKEEFDILHGQIWEDMDIELIAEGFKKAPVPPEPIRNPLEELDELKADIQAIKTKLGI